MASGDSASWYQILYTLKTDFMLRGRCFSFDQNKKRHWSCLALLYFWQFPFPNGRANLDSLEWRMCVILDCNDPGSQKDHAASNKGLKPVFAHAVALIGDIPRHRQPRTMLSQNRQNRRRGGLRWHLEQLGRLQGLPSSHPTVFRAPLAGRGGHLFFGLVRLEDCHPGTECL